MFKIVLKTMTVSDCAIAFGMMASLAVILVQYSRLLALPAHFA